MHISQFLQKFSGLRPPEKYIKETFAEAVFVDVGIVIDTNKLRLQGDVLYVDEHPAIKSEIFFHKGHLMGILKETLGRKAPRDIL